MRTYQINKNVNSKLVKNLGGKTKVKFTMQSFMIC